MHYHVPKPFFRKSRDTWYVEVDGRQINLGKNRDAAFQRYHEIMAVPEHERQQRHVGSGAGMRLTELFDRFLDWVQQHRSPDTFVWYQYRLQRFADRNPDLTVGQLKPFHVQEWVDTYKDHSPTTTRNYMRCLKRCLKWGKSLGYVDGNPIELLTVPMARTRDVYVPPEEFADLLTFVVDPGFRDLLKVTYETGCRPQESLRLEIRHVDLEQKRWVIPRSEAKGKQAPRVVYLSDKALAIVVRLIDGRKEGFVFRNSRGNKWTTCAVNCSFQRVRNRMGKKAMKALGVTVSEDEIQSQITLLKPVRRCGKKQVHKTPADLRREARKKLVLKMVQDYASVYSLYALRHSWATNALQRGVDALTVAILMGHKDPSQLAKVYQHLSHNPKHLLEQAKKAAS
jgi:integrase